MCGPNCGLLQAARALLEASPALAGAPGLGFDGPAWLITLDLWASMSVADQLRLLMQSSTAATVEDDIITRFVCVVSR